MELNSAKPVIVAVPHVLCFARAGSFHLSLNLDSEGANAFSTSHCRLGRAYKPQTSTITQFDDKFDLEAL
jgi:hypothetical protein